MADLPRGVTKDPDTEQLMKDGEPWQPPPTLEQQIQQKQQEIDQLEHQAKIDGAKADSAQAAADLKEAEVELFKLQGQQAAGQEGQQQNADMLDGIRETIETTMQKHIDNPNAHAAMNIEDLVANAIVEALQRVRGYVDRQVKAGKITPVDSTAPPGTQTVTKQAPGNGQLAPVLLKTEPVVQEAPRPDRLRIVQEDDGAVVATPEYDKEEAPQPDRLKFVRADDGSMVATPEYGDQDDAA